jgi:hypothetical protein
VATSSMWDVAATKMDQIRREISEGRWSIYVEYVGFPVDPYVICPPSTIVLSKARNDPKYRATYSPFIPGSIKGKSYQRPASFTNISGIVERRGVTHEPHIRPIRVLVKSSQIPVVVR